MRTIELTESHSKVEPLSFEQAAALRKIGRELASRQNIFDTTDNGIDSATVITCSAVSATHWNIIVDNAVGIVAIPNLQLIVRPKIPLTHLAYFFDRAFAIPRQSDSPTTVADEYAFIELVARWYLRALGQLLRRELLRSYHEVDDVSPIARGTLDVIETGRMFYSGSMFVACNYDEFDADTPLNRVLKAALTLISRHGIFSGETRKRARLYVGRFSDVGEIRESDLLADIDKASESYSRALPLARLLLKSSGHTIAEGSLRGWSFLIPTPLAVEAAIRSILREDLRAVCRVTAGREVLPGGISVNPDLWFASLGATGDVKYKLNVGQWNRPDLYQAVAFAAAMRAQQALIIGFDNSDRKDLAPATFGEIVVTSLSYRSGEELEPAIAALELCAQVRGWLGIPGSSPEAIHPEGSQSYVL